MNAAKTFHLSFTLAPNNKLLTHYFIGNERIREVNQHTDLGIIFDEKLRFTAQAAAEVLRAKSMHGATYRFARKLHLPKLCCEIIETYIIPIIEYGSIIWRRDTATQNRSLEATQRMGTRLALQLPFFPMNRRYRTYTYRLAALNTLSMEDRYTTVQIALWAIAYRVKLTHT